VNPIHPSLAPLALAAARKDFALLETELGKALRAPAWLRPEHRVGDPTHYMRHVLYVDPEDRFVVTAITWLPGQRSPLHGHQVWCMFGVAEGELTEERFDPLGRPSGQASLAAGTLAAPDLDQKAVHRVSNQGDRTLVSLHLYGVSAARLTTGINRILR
jgi:predicted metal-dependent enzyme (double-stranded beta helix superfamily)